MTLRFPLVLRSRLNDAQDRIHMLEAQLRTSLHRSAALELDLKEEANARAIMSNNLREVTKDLGATVKDLRVLTVAIGKILPAAGEPQAPSSVSANDRLAAKRERERLRGSVGPGPRVE